MAIIQVPLEIPDDVYARLLAGDYVRMGGVVRDQGGQLVKLLNDAVQTEDGQEAMKAGIGKVLGNRTVVGVAIGVVAIAATAGGAVYRAKQKAKSDQFVMPTCVEHYSDSLAAYLEAAREGTLNATIISRLIVDLDAIRGEIDTRTTGLEFSPEQSETLVDMVADHTRALARANDRELRSIPRATGSQGATIIDLRPYLEAQQDLFSQAA